ncbi:hypothetical protein GUJ93_ZPchr0015g6631 [Zizania palustris]|uniref:Uncharacterized protein n=1 Tax=Zizania palustris TaxID=103762 RepID=A0A8J5W666_ZIZPA|nr:hypothetical protein GUJ93_ZPchr0015g6631 [Zizania palustris]
MRSIVTTKKLRSCGQKNHLSSFSSKTGRLLRSAQPELMDTLIQASKDGDDSKLLALMNGNILLIEDEVEDDLPYEEEDNKEYKEIADRWLEGLLCKDISVTNEVYAIHNVEFDRQVH